MRVSELFNTLLFTQQEQQEGQVQQDMRVSELFNTLLFTQQEEEEQQVRVSELFNTHHVIVVHSESCEQHIVTSHSDLVFVAFARR